MVEAHEQVERFDTRVEIDVVTEVDFAHGSPFAVKVYDNEYRTKSVIVCTGATPRRLGVPGEKELTGNGVSFCATCDGFFFANSTASCNSFESIPKSSGLRFSQASPFGGK